MKNTIEWIKGFLIAGLTGAIITLILIGSYEIGNAYRVARKVEALREINGLESDGVHYVDILGGRYTLEIQLND